MRKEKSSIVVVGSSNTDMIIKLERAPRAGETVLGGEFFMAAGGKGANQAVAAARAGGRVTLIARVGRDLFGEQAISGFRSDGIGTSHITRDPRKASGAALIFVAQNGENSIAVAGGANSRLSAGDIKKASNAIAGAKILLTQLETPINTVLAAVRIASSTDAMVILNPAPAQRLPDRLLRHVSILTPNESEAELLTGVKLRNLTAAERAAKQLRGRGVATVIITLGERGALIADENGTRRIPGFRVKAVDTTAAGDTFNGALAVALTEKQPINHAVRFANAAAAIAVTRLGAQTSVPTRKEIDKFLSE